MSDDCDESSDSDYVAESTDNEEPDPIRKFNNGRLTVRGNSNVSELPKK